MNKNNTCRFVAAKRNENGTLKEFRDNKGNIYNYEQALEAIEKGLIENAMSFTGKDGLRHIRGKNKRKRKEKLAHLKEF